MIVLKLKLLFVYELLNESNIMPINITYYPVNDKRHISSILSIKESYEI